MNSVGYGDPWQSRAMLVMRRWLLFQAPPGSHGLGTSFVECVYTPAMGYGPEIFVVCMNFLKHLDHPVWSELPYFTESGACINTELEVVAVTLTSYGLQNCAFAM